MTTTIKTYEGNNWTAKAFDLDNGSAYVSFYDADGNKFAEIYCDDYDYGNTEQWIDLDADITSLLGYDYDSCCKELNSWGNGRTENLTPLDSEDWTTEEE